MNRNITSQAFILCFPERLDPSDTNILIIGDIYIYIK